MKLKRQTKTRPFYSREKHEEIYMSDHIVTDILYFKCKC